MGSRLAALAAAAGHDTVLEDIMPSRLRQAAASLTASSLITSSSTSGSPYAPGIHFATSIEDAVRNADLVVDFVPDELESKLEILSLIDRMAPPKATIVTPTESLSIADLASCTYRGERCLGVRFLASGLLAGDEIRLVTISRTDPLAIKQVTSFWSSLGLRVVQELDPAEPRVNSGILF